jgi:hypothetical protein
VIPVQRVHVELREIKVVEAPEDIKDTKESEVIEDLLEQRDLKE